MQAKDIDEEIYQNERIRANLWTEGNTRKDHVDILRTYPMTH